MSEKTIRHLIAFCGTLVAVLAWWAGYASGVRGWWWTVLALGIIYWAIFTLVEA